MEVLSTVALPDILEVLLFSLGTIWLGDLIFLPLLLVYFSTDLDLLHTYRLKIRTGPCKFILELTCKRIFTHAKAESSVLNKHFCLHIILGATAIQMDLVKPETTFTD